MKFIILLLLVLLPATSFAIDPTKVQQSVGECINTKSTQAQSKELALQARFLCLPDVGLRLMSLKELAAASEKEVTEEDRQNSLKGMDCYFENLGRFATPITGTITFSSCMVVHDTIESVKKEYKQLNIIQIKAAKKLASCFLENLEKVFTDADMKNLVDACTKKSPLGKAAFKIVLKQNLRITLDKQKKQTPEQVKMTQLFLRSLQMPQAIQMF